MSFFSHESESNGERKSEMRQNDSNGNERKGC